MVLWAFIAVMLLMGEPNDTHLNVDPTQKECEYWLGLQKEYREENKEAMAEDGYRLILSEECFKIIVETDGIEI